MTQSSQSIHAHHIAVCICTFKRAELLGRLLATLAHQQTAGLFTYSVVVADNDAARSAEQVVTAFSQTACFQVSYCVEPRQNIALARNRALRHAQGNLIAFIDDDELPEDDWLLNLFRTREACGVDGVLGLVKPYFEFSPPDWVKRGRFFERPTPATGENVTCYAARTGNVLFRKAILKGVGTPFRHQFATAGEDIDFFRRAMEAGY